MAISLYHIHPHRHNDTNPACVISSISSPPSGPSTISATVTFKVAHGAWDDGTKDNKTVTLTGYSPLTLSTSQIPAVGTKPDEGYKAGSWDTVPATSITRSITFTYSYVKKPAASITKEPTARDLTENGKPQELVTAGEATGGTMEYALGVTAGGWSTSIPTATNAGVYYVWNKVVGDADHSSTEPKCIVVTVKYGPGTLIYNGKDQELVIPGTVQGGTMVYVLGTDDVTAPDEGWTDVIPKGKEVGDYYVWYKVLGDANHKDTEPRCIKVTIVPDSQVEQFEELIKTLPEKVTLENSYLVKALRRALYDSLSDDQKKLIPEEDVRKLETAEEKTNELNRAAAERFTIAVNAIPRSEAGEGKGMLDAATEIYNNITEEQKALVSDDTMALYNEAIAAFKKDRQFRSGDAYYKVLSNGDVTYLKPASKDITNVTVPNQVKKGKFLFKVIKVSNNAFRNCGNLKWAVIGKNVRVFGEYVFARAYNLKTVRVLGYGFKSGKVTNAFVKAGKKGKLTVKVPGNKVDEYQKLFTGEGKLNGKVEAA